MNVQLMPGNASMNIIQEDVRKGNGSMKPVQIQRSAMPVNANRIRIRIQALMNVQAMPGNASMNIIQKDVRAANGS